MSISNPAGVNATLLGAIIKYSSTFPDFDSTFVPPAWSNPQYVAPNRRLRVEVIALLSMTLATIVVCSRLLARIIRGQRRLGWDDASIFIAMLSTIGFTIVQMIVTRVGCIGQHGYDCPLTRIVYTYQYRAIGILLYISGAACIKLSISLFLLRLCPSSDVVLRRIVLATIAVVLMSWIGPIFQIVFACHPIATAFDLNVKLFQNHHCISEWRSVLGWGVAFVVTDVWLVILPIKMLWKSNFPKNKKVGINLILGCGAVAAVTTIVKVAYIKEAYDSWDFSWSFINILIFSQLELTLGLIAASLPALGFLLIPPISWVLQNYRNFSVKASAGFSAIFSTPSFPSKKTPTNIVGQHKRVSTSPSSTLPFSEGVDLDTTWTEVSKGPQYLPQPNKETFWNSQTSGDTHSFGEIYSTDEIDNYSVDLVIQRPPDLRGRN